MTETTAEKLAEMVEAANETCDCGQQCERCDSGEEAFTLLRNLAIPIAEAVLEQHEALGKLLKTCSCTHDRQKHRCRCDLLSAAKDALELKELGKAMKV